MKKSCRLDRLGTARIGPHWLRLTWTSNPHFFAAYSLWAFKRRILFKPINYDTLNLENARG